MSEATRVIQIVLTSNTASAIYGLTKTSQAMGKFVDVINDAENALGKIEGTFKRTGHVVLGFGVGVQLSLFGAVKSFSSFETQMRNVMTVTTDKAANSFGKMSKSVLELSTTVPQGAVALADALYNIDSSGFQGAKALDLLKVSAIASTAGLTDTTTAATAIVAVMNSYPNKIKSAAQASDILFQGVNVGIFNFQQLNQVLGDFLGYASAAGISLNDAVAAIATFTLQGVPVAQTGTLLSAVIRKILQPSEELNTVFRTLGISSKDLSSDGIGLAGIMQKLAQYTGGNVQKMQDLFQESDAVRGALFLMGNNGKTLNGVMEQMNSKTAVAGATQRAFAEQSKSLSAQFQILQNNLMAIGISIGSALTPPLKGLVSMATAVTGAINAIPDPLKNILTYLTAFGSLILIVVGASLSWATVTLMITAAHILWQKGLAKLGIDTGKLTLKIQQQIPVVSNWGTNFVMAHTKAGRLQSGLLMITGGINRLNTSLKNNAVGNWTRQLIIAHTKVGPFRSALLTTTATVGRFGTVLRTAGNLVTKLFMKLSPYIALSTAVYGLVQAYQEGQQAARDFFNEATQDVTPASLDKAGAAVEKINIKLRDLKKELPSQSFFGKLGASVQAIGGAVMSPFGVDIDNPLKKVAEYNELLKQRKQYEFEITQAQGALQILAGATGLNAEETGKWADKLGITVEQLGLLNLDVNSAEFQDLASKIIEANRAAGQGTDASVRLAQAQKDLADKTKDASDRLNAFKQIVDSIFGTSALNMQEAAAGFQEAMRGVYWQVKNTGVSFDATTVKGAGFIKTLTAAKAAGLELVNTTYQMTGSEKQASEAMVSVIDNLVAMGRQAGMSDKDIAQMIRTMGFTPESIKTYFESIGIKDSTSAVSWLQHLLGVLDGTIATATVNVNVHAEQLNSLMNSGLIPKQTGWLTSGASITPPKFEPGENPQKAGGGGGQEFTALDEAKAMHELGMITDDELRAAMDKNLATLKKGSKEWYDAMIEIKQMDDSIAQERLDILGKQRDQGEISTREYIDQLRRIRDYMALFGKDTKDIDAMIVDAQRNLVSEDRQMWADRVELGAMTLEEEKKNLEEQLKTFKEWSQEWIEAKKALATVDKEIADKAKQAADDAKQAAEAEKQKRQDIASRQKDIVSQLRSTYASARDALQSAQASLKSALDAIANEVADPIRALGRLSGAFTGLGVTTKEVMDELRSRLAQAREWAAVSKQLMASGLNQDFLRDILAGGPQNLDLAKAVLGGNPQEINQILNEIGGLAGGAGAAWQGLAAGGDTAVQDALQAVAQASSEMSRAKLALDELHKSTEDDTDAIKQMVEEYKQLAQGIIPEATDKIDTMTGSQDLNLTKTKDQITAQEGLQEAMKRTTEEYIPKEIAQFDLLTAAMLNAYRAAQLLTENGIQLPNSGGGNSNVSNRTTNYNANVYVDPSSYSTRPLITAFQTMEFLGA